MAVYIPLSGSMQTLLSNSRPVSPINPSEITSLTVRVRSLGDPEALARKAYNLAETPISERKYLTHEEIEKLHGARREDLDTIEHFAQDYDLMTVHRSAAERSVVLKGKLGDLLEAFHANVQIYHHVSGTYRGRNGEIMLPERLSPIVTAVFGFDTRPKYRVRQYRMSEPHGRLNGQTGLAAKDFAKLYNFPHASNCTSLDGLGQTIAIIELGAGYRRGDLKASFKVIGLTPPKVSSICVDYAGNEQVIVDSADRDVMWDLFIAGAVAPKAKCAVYFAQNSDKGIFDAISAAVHDAQRKPSVISIAWGDRECSIDQQALNAYHELFVAAGALGITVCAASGDYGVVGQGASECNEKIHVGHPACDDMVLGCGEEDMDVNRTNSGRYGRLSFNVSMPCADGSWTGFGGISEIFPVPPYQANAKLPVSIDSGNPGRGVPDVALVANNFPGLEIASGRRNVAAPLMAALIVRLNQAKRKNVGFLNPFLYSTVAKEGGLNSHFFEHISVLVSPNDYPT